MTIYVVKDKQEVKKMNKWDIDEFIKVLNIEVPRNGTNNDKRRTDFWNVRLLRSYTTEKKISLPLKEGRKAFYTDKHLEEVKQLFIFQEIGMSSKKLPSSQFYNTGIYSSILQEDSGIKNEMQINLTETNSHSCKAQALSLLGNGPGMLNLNRNLELSGSLNKRIVSEDPVWKKIEITTGVELMIEQEHWSKIELIKAEIKKLIK